MDLIITLKKHHQGPVQVPQASEKKRGTRLQKTKSIEQNEGLYKGYENYYTSVHAGRSNQCPKHRFVHTCSNTPNQRLKTTTKVSSHNYCKATTTSPTIKWKHQWGTRIWQYLVRACT